MNELFSTCLFVSSSSSPYEIKILGKKPFSVLGLTFLRNELFCELISEILKFS